MRWRRSVLECPRSEQEIDDVAFVRLQPVELQRFNFANIQPVDVRGVNQFLRKRIVFRDAGADQRVVNLLLHLILRALDD